MKNNKIQIIAVIIFLAIIFVLMQSFRQIHENQSFIPLPSAMPPHQIERLNGLEIKWQLLNTFIEYRENGPHMMASNGKIFFLGGLGANSSFHVIGLNEVDGSIFIKTDPVKGGTEFTVDENALYIAENIAEISKIDLVSQQEIWNQVLGNSHGPCCINITNGELQSYWYPFRFYIQSTKDGKIIQQVKDTQDYMYRIENGIRYRRGGSSFLLAQNEDNSILWQVDLDEYLQAPVFSTNTIYVRTGNRMGRVFAVDRASGKIRWQTEPIVISNLAVSNNRVYYLTYDGQLLGVKGETGEIEKSSAILPGDLNPITTKPSGYEVAYDGDTHMVFLLLGNSAQMIALEEY